MADDIKGNEAAAQSLEIRTLLKAMMQYGASDLHLSSGSPPQLRVDGRLRQLRADILRPADTKRLCMSILTEKQRRDFEDKNDMDVSFGVEKLARFRANIFRQRGAIAGSFRKIPYEVPKISTLGVPDDFVRLVSKPNGLVLVTGPTGAGKSTTLAAAIDKINAERHCHIVTIEVTRQPERGWCGYGLISRRTQVRLTTRPRRDSHRRDARYRNGRGGTGS